MNLKNLLNSDDYRDSIETVLEKCTHKTRVKFALYCAEGLEKYYDFNKYPEVKKTRQVCLDLVTNWLLDPKSVTNIAMREAANSANSAANSAHAAANSANSAAYAANSAYSAANSAANSAYSAANSAYSAANAAHAANSANSAAYAANSAYSAANSAADSATHFDSTKQEYLKGLFYHLVKLYLTETDSSFKEETFNLLYLNRSSL